MVKIVAILAPSSVPYQMGGAEKSWWGLREALGELPDCQAELVKLPTRENSFAELVDSYEMFSKLDLSHFDVLITTKYPAWITPHSNHICYLYHTLRGLYDSYHFTGLPETLPTVPRQLRELVELIRMDEPKRTDLPMAFELCRRALTTKSLPSAIFAFPGPLIREVVHFFDRIALAPGQIRAYFTLSATVARRKDYFPPGVQVDVLPLPPNRADFFCGQGKYFFTASRLNSCKRIGMLIDAMRHVRANVPFKIAGTGPDLEILRKQAADDPRIEFLGYVPDSGLSALYADAIAVPFVPYDEDYGLIAVEAFKSGKPVITCNDAGGVCEMVKDGENGIVTAPNAPALGHAMNKLAEDRQLAAQMGAAGQKGIATLTWRKTAERLLSAPECTPLPKIVVACSFAADAVGHGGARRLHHLCRQLGQAFRVTLVCLGEKTQNKIEQDTLASNVLQIQLPWPQAALTEAEKLINDTGISADDIAILHHAANPDIVAALAAAGKDAIGAVACHPWLFPALQAALPKLPLAYDAQDVEADIKKDMLGKESGLLADVIQAEQCLTQNADFIFACSESDASRLCELYAIEPGRLLVLPNGCEPRGRQRDYATLRQRLEYSETPLVVFLGSGHKPNVDAALAIFAMAREVPEAEFLLAGTVSTQKTIKNSTRPANVHLLGKISEEVKNVLLEAADIALNPVVTGSGINLKIVEYLAFGIPCISTPCGMRGMPADLGDVVRICELADFPVHIHQILADPPAADTMAETASHILQRFAWKTVLGPLCPALNVWKDRQCA